MLYAFRPIFKGYKTAIIIIIFLLSITSCSKDPFIGSQILLNDSLFYFNSSPYDLDLTQDGNNDVRFIFNHSYSPGGHNTRNFKIIMLNSNINVCVATEVDTICKDTVIRSGFETYNYYNCNNSTHIFSIDTTIYAPTFGYKEINSTPNIYNAKDTVIFSIYDFSSPVSPYPGARYYNIKKGALINESEGYIIFIVNMNNKKALHIKLKTPYIHIIKIINLN
jgi:hypothetical protein